MKKANLLLKLEVAFGVVELMFVGLSSSAKDKKNKKIFKNCALLSFLGMLASYGGVLFCLSKTNEKEEEPEKIDVEE